MIFHVCHTTCMRRSISSWLTLNVQIMRSILRMYFLLRLSFNHLCFSIRECVIQFCGLLWIFSGWFAGLLFLLIFYYRAIILIFDMWHFKSRVCKRCGCSFCCSLWKALGTNSLILKRKKVMKTQSCLKGEGLCCSSIHYLNCIFWGMTWWSLFWIPVLLPNPNDLSKVSA